MNTNENDQYSDSDFEFMFLIEGYHSSGKSSLLYRYVNDEFPALNNFASIGANFEFIKLNIDNYKVKLTIWDNSGSEVIGKILRKRLYSKLGCIFILVDLSDSLESFDFFENILRNIKELASEPVIVLVGSKSDLPRKDENEILIKWAKEKDIFYIETSAKYGYNVNETIYLGTRELINKINRSEYRYYTKNYIVLKSQEFKWYRENTCL